MRLPRDGLKGVRFLAVLIVFVMLSGRGRLNAQTPKGPALPPLNAKVVEFAKEHLGEKVGNGECTSLASEALKAAGAKRFRMKPGEDYVWGEPIESFRDALPGDIVQFRDAVFAGRARLNGVGGGISFWRFEFPHHTAIISRVRERGRQVTFLHQNTGTADMTEEAKRLVKEETIRVESLKPGGKVWIYRPVAPESELRPDIETDDDDETNPRRSRFDRRRPTSLELKSGDEKP